MRAGRGFRQAARRPVAGRDGGLSAPHGACRASPRGYFSRAEAAGQGCGEAAAWARC